MSPFPTNRFPTWLRFCWRQAVIHRDDVTSQSDTCVKPQKTPADATYDITAPTPRCTRHIISQHSTLNTQHSTLNTTHVLIEIQTTRIMLVLLGTLSSDILAIQGALRYPWPIVSVKLGSELSRTIQL